jgi:hypothetical protein
LHRQTELAKKQARSILRRDVGKEPDIAIAGRRRLTVAILIRSTTYSQAWARHARRLVTTKWMFMSTLLVLGSKPEPALPPRNAFDALACANASGHSAARFSLGTPHFTTMSASLTLGHAPANKMALQALCGLRTDVLYLYPRSTPAGGLIRRLSRYIRNYRSTPWYVRPKLTSLGYRWNEFRNPGLAYYQMVFQTLCDDDPRMLSCMARKRPSTGLLALALGISMGRYSRYILAGFSFQITHAYADNPRIAERNSADSMHADTDIALLTRWSRKFGTIFTTEAIVNQRAGVPLLPPEAGGSALRQHCHDVRSLGHAE